MTHDVPATNPSDREHVISRQCWCCPTIDYDRNRITHHTPVVIVRQQEDE